VLFAAIAVTGVLMFYHVKNGSVVIIHEWLGMLFAAAGLVHVIINFRQLAAYFKTKQCVVAVAIALGLVALFAAAGPFHPEGPHGHRGPQAAEAPGQ
jgi:hypothetical protein